MDRRENIYRKERGQSKFDRDRSKKWFKDKSELL